MTMTSKQEYFAHPQALVDEGARIGKETRIWAFAHVLRGAEIGAGCNIGDYACVEGGARLGDQVTVKNGVQVWEGVTAEDGVFLGPGCVLTNDFRPRAFIKPPKEQWLMRTLLRQGCTIGAGAVVVCGVTVGRFAFIAAGAVVTREVPDHALIVGCPGKITGWVCRCANRIEFSGANGRCVKCGERYVRNESRGEVRRADEGSTTSP
jgi:UDP-2-acetamido-3-amino-2,3-dideoxy-glucuronate N-acetyltransferase